MGLGVNRRKEAKMKFFAGSGIPRGQVYLVTVVVGQGTIIVLSVQRVMYIHTYKTLPLGGGAVRSEAWPLFTPLGSTGTWYMYTCTWYLGTT